MDPIWTVGLMTGTVLDGNIDVAILRTDGERVTGIRGYAAGGAMVTEQARIVIGADGMRSLVARGVQAPVYNARPALTCACAARGAPRA